jgi:hypothetical protein
MALYNNVIVRINDETFDLTGFITKITYYTGAQSAYFHGMNNEANPKLNLVNQEPGGTIEFGSASGIQAFYTWLNSRPRFSLTYEEYVTGQLGGDSHTVIIPEAIADGNSGSASAQSAANIKTFNFKSTTVSQ